MTNQRWGLALKGEHPFSLKQAIIKNPPQCGAGMAHRRSRIAGEDQVFYAEINKTL